MDTKYLIIGGVALGVVGVVYYLNKSGANLTTQATPPAPGFVTQQAAQQAAMQAAMAQAQAQAASQPAPVMATPQMVNASFQQPGENLPQSFPPFNLNPPTSSPGTPSMSSSTQMKAPPPNLAATKMALRRPAPATAPPVPPRPAGPGIFPGGFPGFPISMGDNLPWRMPSARMPGPNLNRLRRG
jgi:hypothetical protein